MQRLLTSLAYQALLRAKNQYPESSIHDIIEYAWDIYLQMTRYSPGCDKKNFIDWAFTEHRLCDRLIIDNAQ